MAVNYATSLLDALDALSERRSFHAKPEYDPGEYKPDADSWFVFANYAVLFSLMALVGLVVQAVL
jgi:hypothetical protein